MQANPLAQLREFGQSVWCDDIGRELLTSGGLLALIERDGVCGVTSNPTIFHKAITGGSAYDADISRLISEGVSAAQSMEALTLADIGMAAEQLRSVFDHTHKRDGWVSIEVAPSLAYDTQATVAEVKRLRSLLDHPNVMVKVPGTAEGVAAVHDLVGLGYSINVTLIFSVDRYGEVIEAYLSGLEGLLARREAGEDVPVLADVHGVASFFVSRIDSAVDKRLYSLATQMPADGEEPGPVASMRGRAAVSNAKVAYQLFRERFSGPRWRALRDAGANMQRPLWASTSTKDPAYSDILYVQELIGPDTVNTMPLATLDAYRDHGYPEETVTEGVDLALAHMEALAGLGVDMGEVTAQLERDGVTAFADSHDALRSALEQIQAQGLGRADG